MPATHSSPLCLKSIAIASLGLCLAWGSVAVAFADEAKPKPRIVARYSESGIVSNTGQEKSKFINIYRPMA